MPATSSSENSPAEMVDQSLTADTTPSPDEVSLNQKQQPANKKRKALSQLDKLLADMDWYTTSFGSGRTARGSSIKRFEQKIEEGPKFEKRELTEDEKAKKKEQTLKRVEKRKEEREKKRIKQLEAREKRERLKLEGLLPELKPKTSSISKDLKEVLEGASWFNRDANITTTLRQNRTQTTFFVIEEEPVKKQARKKLITPKIKEEDSRLKSRGQAKRNNELKRNKKTVKTTTKKVKKEKIKKEATSTPEVEEVIEEVVEEELFNWFLDLDDDELVPIGTRKIFIDEIYKDQLLATDYSNLEENEMLVSAASLISHFKNHYTNNDKLPYTEVSLSTLFSNYKEEYILSIPKDDELNPFVEIGRAMELMAMLFLPEPLKIQVRNDEKPEDSIVGRYIQLYSEENMLGLLTEIAAFNKLIDSTRQSKQFLEHLQKITHISRTVFHEILNQSYSRTVSPNVQALRSYKAFSNEVYGELLPSFLSMVYKKTEMDHTKTFIDIGSGVGNCVLQAALEYGCKSYGCEIMQNASKLSDLQLKEFNKRCKVFGIRPGIVENFLSQSFVNNDGVTKAVNECDIILCNNYLFDADLNAKAVELFRHLKTGTKIITLKPIVPLGYSFNANDVESILNRLTVEKFSYGFNSVSWTNNGGTYYISEVQQDIVPEYFKEHAKSRTRTRGN